MNDAKKPAFEHYNPAVTESFVEASKNLDGLAGFLGLRIVEGGPGWMRAEAEAKKRAVEAEAQRKKALEESRRKAAGDERARRKAEKEARERAEKEAKAKRKAEGAARKRDSAVIWRMPPTSNTPMAISTNNAQPPAGSRVQIPQSCPATTLEIPLTITTPDA